jgi:hypothetical protein
VVATISSSVCNEQALDFEYVFFFSGMSKIKFTYINSVHDSLYIEMYTLQVTLSFYNFNSLFVCLEPLFCHLYTFFVN